MLEVETWTALLISALKYVNNINNSFVMHEHLGLETKDLQGGAVAFIYTSWYNIKQQGKKTNNSKNTPNFMVQEKSLSGLKHKYEIPN